MVFWWSEYFPCCTARQKISSSRDSLKKTPKTFVLALYLFFFFFPHCLLSMWQVYKICSGDDAPPRLVHLQDMYSIGYTRIVFFLTFVIFSCRCISSSCRLLSASFSVFLHFSWFRYRD